MGGQSAVDPDDATRQCASVNWISDTAIPEGVSVEITGFVFSWDDFEEQDGACLEGAPACEGFAFRSDASQCGLPVTAPEEDDPAADQPVLTVDGRVHCPDRAVEACREFAAAVDREPGGSIDLERPPPRQETAPATPTSGSTTTPPPGGSTLDSSGGTPSAPATSVGASAAGTTG